MRSDECADHLFLNIVNLFYIHASEKNILLASVIRNNKIDLSTVYIGSIHATKGTIQMPIKCVFSSSSPVHMRAIRQKLEIVAAHILCFRQH